MEYVILQKRLETLGEVSTSGRRCKDLHRVVKLPEIWYEAYANIYSNKGAMTQGIDDNTLDGMSKDRINEIINSIKEGNYKPKPVKRVYIPKGNGKKRPLGVPTGNDKLAQEVCRIILESIYEPIFSDFSHGFRPNRSCHTALEQIQNTWAGTQWIIEFDIKGFFDNMNHDIMIELLEKKIDDYRFIKLIKDFMKAGYLEDWQFHKTYSGTPQGGIISPILSNIYLHELDVYIEKLTLEYNRGKRRPPNPEYQRLAGKIYRLRKKYDKEKSESILHTIKELTREMQKLPCGNMHTDDFRRLRHCRYADDFICSVIGSRKDAKSIMRNINDFLNHNLNLDTSPEKTDIGKATKGIQFLSYGIRIQYGEKIKKVKQRGRIMNKRTIAGSILFTVPRDRIKEFCKKYGYGIWEDTKPTHRPELINFSEYEIVVVYNAEIRGLCEYYKLARNFKSSLSKIQYLNLYSLIFTLASKGKTKKTTIFKRLREGKEFILNYKVKGETKRLKVFQLKHMTKESKPPPDTIPNTNNLTLSRNELIKRLEADECEYCGSKGECEVHHVKKLKDLRNKSHLELWQRVMISRNRKTLILCVECHDLLHKGKLPDNRYSPK